MFGEQFYPTPPHLVTKMLEGLNPEEITTVLEPSAGKGDIIKSLIEWNRSKSGYHAEKIDIECIEIDKNLQHILKGMEYRVVHDNFLTYETYRSYDLIIMNPPFADGDMHLLKALEIQKNGGKIVCILNLETIKNPYTNARKALLNKLEEYKAEVFALSGEFEQAERKTSVDIALIKINIPQKHEDSILLDGLKRAEQEKEAGLEAREVVTGTVIDQLIEFYRHECKIGITLINEYEKIRLYQSNNEQDQDIIDLSVNDSKRGNLKNRYLRCVRRKYWRKLFQNKEWQAKLTSNLHDELYNKLHELQDYEFSLFNIQRLWRETMSQLGKSLERTVIDLFDEFSNRHHYAEYSKNVHYYNGWKTNKCWIINKRVIIPLDAYSFLGSYRPNDWGVGRKLADIEKVFDFLDNKDSDHCSMVSNLKRAEVHQQTRKIETKYFYITFFKKGTCHLEFKDMELLKKFNIFASQRKDWLPPSYGKKQYQDMDAEEKAAIDSFEGAENYIRTMENTDYYIVEADGMMMLPPGA